MIPEKYILEDHDGNVVGIGFDGEKEPIAVRLKVRQADLDLSKLTKGKAMEIAAAEKAGDAVAVLDTVKTNLVAEPVEEPEGQL